MIDCDDDDDDDDDDDNNDELIMEIMRMAMRMGMNGDYGDHNDKLYIHQLNHFTNSKFYRYNHNINVGESL